MSSLSTELVLWLLSEYLRVVLGLDLGLGPDRDFSESVLLLRILWGRVTPFESPLTRTPGECAGGFVKGPGNWIIGIGFGSFSEISSLSASEYDTGLERGQL